MPSCKLLAIFLFIALSPITACADANDHAEPPRSSDPDTPAADAPATQAATTQPATTKPAWPPLYRPYARILARFVDKKGGVNYESLQRHRTDLDTFTQSIADLDPNILKQWDKSDQLAFWINAYNALTLQAIVDHYPFTKRTDKSQPANSIRQIPGVWDKLKFTVMAKPLTLNDIEHNIIRKQFNEPRIHLALVCASGGCPALRAEPFIAERLDKQLNAEAKRFLANPVKFHITKDGRVALSSIFDWYGQDFLPLDQRKEKANDRAAKQAAVITFITRFVDEKTANALRAYRGKIRWLDYDWSLNEQPTPKR